MNNFTLITREVLKVNNIDKNHHLFEQCFNAFWEKGIDIIKIKEDSFDVYHLLGDCFNPEANPNVNPTILKKGKMDYLEKIEVEGVFGIGLIVNGEIDYSSFVWGFVGDEYLGSGYDLELIELMGSMTK